ncbi:MAG TPA: GntR family transcriptional regulator [Candidatus Acidoferrales bacterium]|jgi:DNA-binding GntR family transcriptional regulator|nr:GntR family transcriptional regulator [Candidatus Acidoferrales bacterium]
MPSNQGKLVDQIVDALEAAIHNGELLPGRRISELALSSALGVSRGPLREAIRKLEARRLFERTAFHGIRLVDLSIQDLEQLLVVREVLEGAAARAAAENATSVDLATLKRFLSANARRSQSLPLSPKKPALGIHHLIARASKNRWLEEILCKDLYGLLRAYRYLSSDLDHRAEDARREHLKIIDAISKHDADRAETLMRDHNRRGRVNLIDRLKAERGRKQLSSLRLIPREKKMKKQRAK